MPIKPRVGINFGQSLPGAPATHYLGALAIIAISIAVRAALQPFWPTAVPYMLLFPAVILAGLFCGAGPAMLAAIVGDVLASGLFLHTSVLAPPLLNATHLDAALFLPACAIILWVVWTLRRARAGAEQAEARLAEVFRQLPGAASILEAPSGRILLSSRQSSPILGRNMAQSGNMWDLANYGGLRENGSRYDVADYPIARSLNTGEVVSNERLRYRRPDGRIIYLEVHSGPVRDPDGHIVAAVGMAFDVSERVRAEALLRESESRYRAMAERARVAIEAGGLGLWEVDIRTGTMHMDATFAAMLGLDPHPTDIPRGGMRPFIHEDDRPRAIGNLQHTLQTGAPYIEACRMRTAQGRVIWIVSRGALLTDVQKLIGVISDDTERRERENALRTALEARDILMREADHRIKNSLQLVTSLLHLQLSKAVDEPTRQVLGDTIARVDAVAQAHLALQGSPDLRTIALDPMMRDLCARIALLNPDITLVCETSCAIGLDAEPAMKLALIASELLTNALRHAFDPGTPGQVSLNLTREADELILIIADTGRGLPPSPSHAGLGSAVIAALVRQIGADISTSGSPGVSVTLRLRLAEAA